MIILTHREMKTVRSFLALERLFLYVHQVKLYFNVGLYRF